MSEIKYLTDRVTRSHIDLNEEFPEAQNAIDCKIQSSIMVPKEPEVGRKIKCLLDLTIGEEQKTAPYIFIQLVVFFEIVEFSTAQELGNYAEDYCLKKSVDIMQSKVADLTKLHTGVPLEIPLMS